MTLTDEVTRAIKPILDEHMRESRERIAQLERDINEARAHLEVARATCERLTKMRVAAESVCAKLGDTNYRLDEDTREVVEGDLVVVRLTRYSAIDTRSRTANLTADRRDVVGKLVQVQP